MLAVESPALNQAPKHGVATVDLPRGTAVPELQIYRQDAVWPSLQTHPAVFARLLADEGCVRAQGGASNRGCNM